MTQETETTSQDIALALAETIAENMGQDVRILDLRGLTDIADWFVIASAQSRRHLKILGEDLVGDIKSAKIGNIHVEGLNSESWIIIDLFDVVVHLFLQEKREFFALESYWGDAPSIVISANDSGGEDDS
ncbi:MAG TPA: ribosome silencing factor [candidate division Zixibacteria bacterium]|nr:ribosome silencing factor [candidate division Zixibacteria bacterium]